MLAFQIARRYLIAKKSHQAINIISMVALVGVMVGTMGLIIVLSVFNGFGDLVLSLYNSFDPDVKVTAIYSKTFDPDSAGLEKIRQLPAVKTVNLVLEEHALLRYRDRQYIATIKGVSDGFLESVSLKDKILDGEPVLQQGDTNFAIVGGQIAYSLALHLDDPLHSIGVYIPHHDINYQTSMDPSSAFSGSNIYASSVFGIQQDFDSKYVLVPLRWAREIIGRAKNITALEIKIKDGYDAAAVADEISAITGNRFDVKDRYRQHDFLYKILTSEKLAVFMILGFILLIATFNIIGTLTMLIIEKKKDIALLLSMGADMKLVQQIFLLEGLLISLAGAIAGLAFGTLICFLQQHFGIIKLENSENFLINAYPVQMQLPDFFYVFITVFAIGAAASWYTATAIVKKQVPDSIMNN
jgi:lipoprotein-releasing system permease protein